jgi:hypothetical protein
MTADFRGWPADGKRAERKARVGVRAFPEPVFAMPMQSRPSMHTGIACARSPGARRAHRGGLGVLTRGYSECSHGGPGGLGGLTRGYSECSHGSIRNARCTVCARGAPWYLLSTHGVLLSAHSSTCAWMGVGLSNLLLVIQSSTRFESPHWPTHGTGTFDARE